MCRTDYSHNAKFTAFPYGVSKKIEDYALQSFRNNAPKGRQIMEQVIVRIKAELDDSLAKAERLKTEAEESIAAIEKSFSLETQRVGQEILNNSLRS